jgi:hypothetical protein
MKPNQKLSKLLAWGLLATLPLMAGMCGPAEEAAGPPPCPAQDPAPARQDGELVRFEYGITDLQGRPKNCFRQGEGFRLYLYVINKTETLLFVPNDGNLRPTLTDVDRPGAPSVEVQGLQCRIGGKNIPALDTFILEMPLERDIQSMGLFKEPYPGYGKSMCTRPEWHLGKDEKGGDKNLVTGRYLARFNAVVRVSVPSMPANDHSNRYVSHPFQAEIPFTIQ